MVWYLLILRRSDEPIFRKNIGGRGDRNYLLVNLKWMQGGHSVLGVQSPLSLNFFNSSGLYLIPSILFTNLELSLGTFSWGFKKIVEGRVVLVISNKKVVFSNCESANFNADIILPPTNPAGCLQTWWYNVGSSNSQYPSTCAPIVQ